MRRSCRPNAKISLFQKNGVVSFNIISITFIKKNSEITLGLDKKNKKIRLAHAV